MRNYLLLSLKRRIFALETSRAVILGWTRQPSIGSHGGQYDTEHWKPRWSVRCGSINFKNIPNYATAHLLHKVCSAVRRHANS